MTLRAALRAHWPEYLIEALALGAFMLAAVAFTVLLQHPESPLRLAAGPDWLRRAPMGLAMGLTAIAIFYSPWGKRSGAHINPAVTLTFLRLGKVAPADALWYVVAQLAGAVAGVLAAAALLGPLAGHPDVRYAVTTPGGHGVAAAFLAEAAMTLVLMSVVLATAGSDRLHRYTGLFAGSLVALYITVEAPISGMSLNPARTFGSAVGAQLWTAFWLYAVAPATGMLLAAQLHLARRPAAALPCAKIQHRTTARCIHCEYQESRPADRSAHAAAGTISEGASF